MSSCVFTLIAGSSQVRFAHTDVRIPSFDDYRKDSVKHSTSKNVDSADARRGFTYLVASGMSSTSSNTCIITKF